MSTTELPEMGTWQTDEPRATVKVWHETEVGVFRQAPVYEGDPFLAAEIVNALHKQNIHASLAWRIPDHQPPVSVSPRHDLTSIIHRQVQRFKRWTKWFGRITGIPW